MPYRKTTLVAGEVYHVCSKSIARYVIFNYEREYKRMLKLISFYQQKELIGFSQFEKLKDVLSYRGRYQPQKLVEIIAYCLMPTHIHLLLRQKIEDGISLYMKSLLSGYSQYFNFRHKRKGPLWAGRFQGVPVETDEQLLHLTRYIHLNPVTAHIIESPEAWEFSSYAEYIDQNERVDSLCKYRDVIEINPMIYREFVLDQVSYQRELAKIKDLLLE